MIYLSKFIALIICIFVVSPLSFAQDTFEIKTKINTNLRLLPKTSIPNISVQFVGKKNLSIRKSPKLQSKTPYYGKVMLGNSRNRQDIIIILDEKNFEKPKVYVDENNNGNLTDDGEPFWTENVEGVLSKKVLLNVVLNEDGLEKEHLLPYKLLRFENPATKQIRVVLQPAFLREGKLKLGEKKYSILVQTYNKKGIFSDRKDITLGIDRDFDGLIDISMLSGEIFWGGSGGGKPFNIDGETYYIKNSSASGKKISLAVSKKKVAPKNYISVGKKAPEFSFKDLYGNKVDFKKLKNKVILLDFWATWCRPCIFNLPKLKVLNEKFSIEDFVILGISLDGGEASEKKTQQMKAFVTKQNLLWHTSFENLGMDSKIGNLYNVVDIPLYIIVDKQGVIQLIVRGSDSEKLKKIQDKIQTLIKE